MIALLLSVLSSSLIFVIFKLFARFKIDTFQAIVVNYFMAFIIGV
ncbi:MAG: EamA/RhaT family transporter, partial [Crocinitomicaceae bacterium]|nr:EamA/RhaT family transporter [Crocinitomicaceae bacterium]